ncbi:ATP-binding protein [Sulfurovum mangrovi]|uniref:ATP-binding protein n=1 Tax=Sulfurovum mangrovi TaxID=2893889 RepID=UPI001E4C978F|nr:ATP-binding protein [Sulfurovum mangrovi]UFH59990.1 ATP-binding protein [Sulfurovum mangrovi]
MKHPLDELDEIIQRALENVEDDISQRVKTVLETKRTPVEPGPLIRLQEKLQLSRFEQLLISILFAPELYAKYEKIYAYLQDDLNRPYPTVQLLEMLLCNTAEQSQALYNYFITPSKLTMLYLIEFASEENNELLFRRPLRLSASLRNYLLGDLHIKGALQSYCRVLEPVEDAACNLEMQSDRRHIINLYGYDDVQKRTEAREIASYFGFGLLSVDSAEALKHEEDTDRLIAQLVRDALLSGTILYLEGFDTFLEDTTPYREKDLLETLEKLAWVSIVSTKSAWSPAELSSDTSFHTIKETRSGQNTRRVAVELNRYAQAIVSSNTQEDIVIPDKQRTQLHQVATHFTHQSRVFEEWGYQKFFQSRGITLLFSGGSGTGKTMAASILANQLGLLLYKIDLSHMVSKYIGETEKNLSKIFELAQGSDVILFFDEADAIFGKRSEVKEAHDRYANIEVSYLLQKIEEYDGIVVLASNFKENIDEAFLRRFRFIIDFPTPDAAHREEIWDKVLPETLLTEPMDFSALANHFKLSGANIRNVALYAAFNAAEDQSKITKAHIVKALINEMEKTGSPFHEEEAAAFLGDSG